jgi:hypothetical protein
MAMMIIINSTLSPSSEWSTKLEMKKLFQFNSKWNFLEAPSINSLMPAS